MCHARGIVCQAIDHQRVGHTFDQIRAVVRCRAVDAETNGRSGFLELFGTALARSEHHVRRWTVTHSDTGTAKPGDLVIIEVDAVRQPCAVVHPTDLLKVLDRTTGELLLTIVD